MSVSLYDLLDVEQDATSDQIRAAWKAAIADLDPTDRRFRAFNDAAGVLLDPEKRAAYDAELAASRGEEDRLEEMAAPESSSVAAAPAEEPAGELIEPAEPIAEPIAEPEEAEADVPVASGPPTWALLAAAFVAVVSVALLIVVLSWPGSLGGTAPADREEQEAQAETAAATAVDAAAEAVPVVLSYDYRTLEEDFADAETYLTDDFAAKRTALFDEEADSGLTLREQVVSDKVVVTALVSRTGLTRVAEDGDRASVVVYVDQDSQKGKQEPRSLRMWATLSMVLDGDDWLIDDICTESDCG